MSKIFQPVIFPLFQEELQKIDPMHSQNTCHNTSMLRWSDLPRASQDVNGDVIRPRGFRQSTTAAMAVEVEEVRCDEDLGAMGK
jgi:hypothetical protein